MRHLQGAASHVYSETLPVLSITEDAANRLNVNKYSMYLSSAWRPFAALCCTIHRWRFKDKLNTVWQAFGDAAALWWPQNLKTGIQLFSFTKNLMVIVQQNRFCHHNCSLIWMWSNVDLEGRDISSTGQYSIVLTSPIIIMGDHLACPRAIGSGKYLLRLVHFYTTYHLCQVCVGTCVCVYQSPVMLVSATPCCIFP